MPKKEISKDNRPKIKIQINNSTLVIVRSFEAIKLWKEKFPTAKLIE